MDRRDLAHRDATTAVVDVRVAATTPHRLSAPCTFGRISHLSKTWVIFIFGVAMFQSSTPRNVF